MLFFDIDICMYALIVCAKLRKRFIPSILLLITRISPYKRSEHISSSINPGEHLNSKPMCLPVCLCVCVCVCVCIMCLYSLLYNLFV